MRSFAVSRKTKETDIQLSVNIDGQGIPDLDVEPEFFKHMLTSMIVHSGMDVKLKVTGDLQHHIIEDVALCFGKAIKKSIGDLTEISRYGQATIPMDCSLAMVAIDVCNRPYSVIDLQTDTPQIEDTQLEDLVHFIRSLATSMKATLHVRVFCGENSHHKIEASFKALGFALRQALRQREVGQPEASSKGVL
ncbi:MAG: imidazoleglycerol-phosphate dehydratase [Candidatus Thorarchaeota archaeon]